MCVNYLKYLFDLLEYPSQCNWYFMQIYTNKYKKILKSMLRCVSDVNLSRCLKNENVDRINKMYN